MYVRLRLRVCVTVCGCVHASMCECVHVCVFVCVCVNMSAGLCVCASVCLFICVYMRVSMSMCARIYERVCARALAYVHVYVCVDET